MKAFRVFLLLAFVWCVVGSTATAQNLMSRTSDFGIVGGLWLGGDIDLAAFSATIEKESGFMARVFYDSYVVEKLAVGAYANYSSASFKGITNTASLIEFGAAIKARFPLAEGAAALVPGLNIGYRIISVDIPNVKDTKGMGLNLSVAVQFASKGFIPFVETGFWAQPTGGNKDTDVTWAPILYIAGGIAF
jgi:hypothetical protein